MGGDSDSGRSEVRTGVLPRCDNTNNSAPWPLFLFSAISHSRGQGLMYAGIGIGGGLLAAGIMALISPAYTQMSLVLILGGFIGATILAERNMTRPVNVISLDNERVMIDRESWWRDEERKIPNSYKAMLDGKRPIAWLYEVEGGLMPFHPWAEPIPETPDGATASDVARVNAVMRSAGRVARHRNPDNRDAVRYGFMALIIVSGLIGAFMGGQEAVDTFITQPGLDQEVVSAP